MGNLRSLVTIIACALAASLSACAESSLPDDRPGADAEHNVRLVYWDTPTVRAAQRAERRGEPVVEGGRVVLEDERARPHPYVWRLRVPGAHLDRVHGPLRPGPTLFGPLDGEQRGSGFAVLTGRMDPDTLEVVPLRDHPGGVDKNYVGVRLKPNSWAYSDWEAGCLSDRYLDGPASREHSYICEDNPNVDACTYDYEVDGWSVVLSVPRRLPQEPELLCERIVKWLDGMTVHRDPLPTQERERKWPK